MSALSKFVQQVSLEDNNTADEMINEGKGMTVMMPAADNIHDMSGTQVEAVGSDIDVVLDAHTALEAYACLLEKAGETGISAEAAGFMQVGMSQIERSLGLAKPITLSVECFGGDISKRQATRVSLESIKERSQELWKMLKELLQKLVQGAGHFIQNLIAGVGRLESHIKDTLDELGGLTDQLHNKRFELENPSRLFADGVFKGQDISPLVGVSRYLNEHYQNEVATYMEKIAAVLNGYASGNTEEFDFSGVLKKIRMIPTPGSGLAEKNNILPGDKELIQLMQRYGDRDGEYAVVGLAIHDMGDEAKPVSGKVDVMVQRTSDIKDRLERALAICGDIRKSRSRDIRVAKASEQLFTALEKFRVARSKNKSNPESGGQMSYDEFSRVIRLVTAIAKNSFTNFQGIAIYLVMTLRAYVAVCEQEMKLHVPKA